MRNYATLLFALCTTLVFSQKLEHFDVILMALNKAPNNIWQTSTPRFLSGFNPQGYNNQPQFFSPNELYLTVQFPADTNQTDIYALNLLTRTTTRVTATTTPEYSPTLMPGGRRFSAVRVEENGAQRLWSFPLDRADNGYPVFPALTNIGYHCWLRDTLAAVFLVGEGTTPHALGIVGTGKQQPVRVAFNIGRCLQKMPDGRLAYVHKATDQTWFLKAYDPVKGGSDILITMPAGSEDFAVLADGIFLAGQGAKIVQCNPGRQNVWQEIADLSTYGVRSISRLAVSPDGSKLALVVQ
ncbi:MAG: hypothetical protein IPM36_23150 [Lewinellaceae bacterium]|nr:hypothetical protein [Lewinellaceae bacterium]